MNKKCVAYLAIAVSLVVLSGCSRNNSNNNSSSESSSQASTETNDNNQNNDMNNDMNNDQNNDMNNDMDNSTGNSSGSNNTSGMNFTNYSDAQNYFLGEMQKENSNYILRDENEDLMDYNEGSQGYRFYLYDTNDESGEMQGEYYLDQGTGKIYMKNKDTNEINEYTGR